MHQLAFKKAKELMPAAFTYLGNVLEDDGAPHGARLQAASMILDRALGKAKETKEITGNININTEHLEALKLINQQFAEQAGRDRKMLDITPQQVSETSDDINDINDLGGNGRQDVSTIASEGEGEDGPGQDLEAPPSKREGSE